MSTQNATLNLDGKDIVLPIVVGTEGERGVDVRKLRDETGYITFDDGYANTGACESKVTSTPTTENCTSRTVRGRSRCLQAAFLTITQRLERGRF